jgi:hypothetical protein
MRRSRRYFILGSLIYSMLISVCCVAQTDTTDGNGHQTGNIVMEKGYVDVLLITTSFLKKDAGLAGAVNQYKNVLEATENLHVGYVELDSEGCLNAYGLKVKDPKDWKEIRVVLGEIIGVTGASHAIILGGELVVPRPVVDACCDEEGNLRSVPSDAWYIDFDGDQIVDEGFAISRFPDLSHSSSAVVAGLQTAITLHTAGGFTLDREVRFNMDHYTTPPYGVCAACTEMKEFSRLMSTSDYIHFAGHGDKTSIYSDAGYTLKFSIDYMDLVDLQTHHPVIVAYTPCYAGGLFPDSSTLSYEFMKAGAATYVARTTSLGAPNQVVSDFPRDIDGGMRIGDALFQAMRIACLDFGDTIKAAAGQICLYGDPTLRRR